MTEIGIQSILMAGGGALLGFMAKELYGAFKKKSDTTDSDIKMLTKEIHTLTVSVVELKVEMKYMTDALSFIKELERDLNNLGAKVRDLSTKP